MQEEGIGAKSANNNERGLDAVVEDVVLRLSASKLEEDDLERRKKERKRKKKENKKEKQRERKRLKTD